MAKRTLRAEPKKECPSCGLGVSPESIVCEFCGWNFEEEDEWILQIEKLERELMLEKQRYEPGTVDHMLESTLRSPLLEKVDSAVPQNEDAIEVEEAEPEREEPVAEETVEEESRPWPEETAQEVAEPKEQEARRVRSVREPEPVVREVDETPRRDISIPIRKVKTRDADEQPPPQRRVRVVAQRTQEEPDAEERPVRRTRTVRRVKR